MKAKELTNLYCFCQVVEHGGFNAASRHSEASPPTLSRAVGQLEEQLGEKLLHRSAKQFQLTNAGEECYRRFAPLFSQVDQQWLNLSNQQAELSGDIHISCPEPFADYFLQRLAIEFMAEHPKVNVHIHFAADADRFMDERIDLAVVTTPATAPHLVQKPLFATPLALAASPQYLERNGEPQSVAELQRHQLLAGNTMPYWPLVENGQEIKLAVTPRYAINSLRLNIDAAVADVGICLMPSAALAELERKGKLQPVLPQVQCPTGRAFLVWTDRKLIAKRVVAFRDRIFTKMADGAEPFLVSMVG